MAANILKALKESSWLKSAEHDENYDCIYSVLSACQLENSRGLRTRSLDILVTENLTETDRNSVALRGIVIKNSRYDLFCDEKLSEFMEYESVSALRELVSDDTLRIEMSMYGGFEQVGSIGQNLPRNDKQITTEPGDIVLYSGNQIVVFYGSNSWSYTKLGHITEQDIERMTELLNSGDVMVTLSVENKR